MSFDSKTWVQETLPLARLRLAERDAELVEAVRGSQRSTEDLERARKAFFDQQRYVHELERTAGDVLLKEAKP